MNSLQTSTDSALCLALDIGEGLLKNGDTVHHVEDTVKRVCTAYGGIHVETFVIGSLMLASVRMADGSHSSQMRRVYDNTNNLTALERFNQLSRTVCATTPDFETAQRMLREVKAQPPLSRWIRVVGGALTSGSFAILFGGSLRDGIAGILVGTLLSLLLLLPAGIITALARTLIMSFVGGIVSYLSVLVGIGQNVDFVMIGAIMLLIPGLAFGNALRDLLCGDILAGLMKTVQSCITAILIACGFWGAILLMDGTGIPNDLPAIHHSFPILLLAAVIGTVAYAGVFGVHPKRFPVAAFCGGAVYTVYTVILELSGMVFPAALLCAIFGAVTALLCAKLFRAPAIVFLTPGIIPIVPGGGLYYTMSYLLRGNSELLLPKSTQTLLISAGIAAGTLLVTMLAEQLQARKTSKNNRKKPTVTT